MIYHYTFAELGERILKDGVIRARPVLVFLDLIGTDALELAPVVWFTKSSDPSPTVLLSGAATGFNVNSPGSVWRFTAEDSVAKKDLVDWACSHSYQTTLFRFMLLTSRLAGEDYEQWRLAEKNVPIEEWVAVERLINGQWELIAFS